MWRPITDIAPLRIALAWPLSSANPAVAAFAEVVRQVSAVDRTGNPRV